MNLNSIQNIPSYQFLISCGLGHLTWATHEPYFPTVLFVKMWVRHGDYGEKIATETEENEGD